MVSERSCLSQGLGGHHKNEVVGREAGKELVLTGMPST